MTDIQGDFHYSDIIAVNKGNQKRRPNTEEER